MGRVVARTLWDNLSSRGAQGTQWAVEDGMHSSGQAPEGVEGRFTALDWGSYMSWKLPDWKNPQSVWGVLVEGTGGWASWNRLVFPIKCIIFTSLYYTNSQIQFSNIYSTQQAGTQNRKSTEKRVMLNEMWELYKVLTLDSDFMLMLNKLRWSRSREDEGRKEKKSVSNTIIFFSVRKNVYRVRDQGNNLRFC